MRDKNGDVERVGVAGLAVVCGGEVEVVAFRASTRRIADERQLGVNLGPALLDICPIERIEPGAGGLRRATGNFGIILIEVVDLNLPASRVQLHDTLGSPVLLRSTTRFRV